MFHFDFLSHLTEEDFQVLLESPRIDFFKILIKYFFSIEWRYRPYDPYKRVLLRKILYNKNKRLKEVLKKNVREVLNEGDLRKVIGFGLFYTLEIDDFIHPLKEMNFLGEFRSVKNMLLRQERKHYEEFKNPSCSYFYIEFFDWFRKRLPEIENQLSQSAFEELMRD